MGGGTLFKVFSAISDTMSQPKMEVSFTINDPAPIKEKLLRMATADARRKAEILCKAQDCVLKNLVSVNYDKEKFDIYSDTRYIYCEKVLTIGRVSFDITPNDIVVSDTVTFTWEIE